MASQSNLGIYSDNSLVAQQNLFIRLVEFAQSTVIKSDRLIDLHETADTFNNWIIEKENFYKNYDPSITLEENILRHESEYQELNSYVIDLVNKANEKNGKQINGTIKPHHVRLLPDYYLLAWSNSVVISDKITNRYKELLIEEAEYLKNVYYNFQFENSLFYIYLAGFLINMSVIIKIMAEYNYTSITLDLLDSYILNNFLVSNGFFLYDKVPLYKKSKFALNLIKLYRTKGSFENMKLISNLLTENGLKVYSVYLFFDEERWIDDDRPSVVSGYYKFLKVDTEAGETFQYVVSNPSLRKQRELNYNDVVDGDNTWKASERDLFEADIKFIKTKYFVIESIRDFKDYSDRLTYLYNNLKYMKDRKILIESNMFFIKDFYEVFKYTEFSLFKKTKFDEELDENLALDVNSIPKTSLLLDEESINYINDNHLEFSSYFNKTYKEIKDFKEKLFKTYNQDEYEELISNPKSPLNKYTVGDARNTLNVLPRINMKYYLEHYDRTLYETLNNPSVPLIANDNFNTILNYLTFAIQINGIDFKIMPNTFLSDNTTFEVIEFFKTFYSELTNNYDYLTYEERETGVTFRDKKSQQIGIHSESDSWQNVLDALMMRYRLNPWEFRHKYLNTDFAKYYMKALDIRIMERDYDLLGMMVDGLYSTVGKHADSDNLSNKERIEILDKNGQVVHTEITGS
jgi:hypothetical protein